MEKLKALINNRWLVFVCAIWVQSFAGIGYLFGSISPVIKSTLGYNQRQIASLGVAKDLGGSFGFAAGFLCEVFPIWGVFLIGVFQNFVGYGLIWLVVTHTLPYFPLWVLCILIFVGANSETYSNTAALVSCIKNFPNSRGPVVGILKGFAGLSGAILTQIYAIFNFPDEASLIFMVAVGPSMVIISLMFIVRPVDIDRQVRRSDNSSFLFTYSVCLVLAAYILAILVLEDMLDMSETLVILCMVFVIVLIILPVVIPISLVYFLDPRLPLHESLLSKSSKQEVGSGFISEVEDEKLEIDLLPTAPIGTVQVEQGKEPRRGEDFTLMQVLKEVDYWLMFISLLLASGSGLTMIDNIGQICQSLGYNNTHIIVSMICVWNFLGRVSGGYFSEIIVRDFAYPRPAAAAVVQAVMAIGFFYYSMGWPGEIYVLTVLIGLGYGAHWAIVPAAASDLFGLKSFGAMYNFLALGNPAGTLIFSGVIASGLYDYYAAKQAIPHQQTTGSDFEFTRSKDESLTCEGLVCYGLTCGILSMFCIIAMVLSLAVVHRTKDAYAQISRKYSLCRNVKATVNL